MLLELQSHRPVCLAQHLHLLQREEVFSGQPQRRHLSSVPLLQHQDLSLEHQLHRLPGLLKQLLRMPHLRLAR